MLSASGSGNGTGNIGRPLGACNRYFGETLQRAVLDSSKPQNEEFAGKYGKRILRPWEEWRFQADLQLQRNSSKTALINMQAKSTPNETKPSRRTRYGINFNNSFAGGLGPP